jgi:hypothetical protein
MTRRVVPPGDIARYWEARHVGRTIRDAASLVGVHYNTALNWEKKAKDATLEHKHATLGLMKASRAVGHHGSKDHTAHMMAATEELNGPVPLHLLNERATQRVGRFRLFPQGVFGACAIKLAG